MTAYHSTQSYTSGQLRQTGADAVRTQRLRAHSKRAWDLYNGLMAVGELDRYYGPLLAAHIYLTRGHASHTVSQRDVARQADLPIDRVKDQMHRLEALGMLSHQREGNRWRTTLLPFLPLADAVRTLAGARSWTEDETTSYVVGLAERGVRLPWALPMTAAGPDHVDAACPPHRGDAPVVQQLREAITAFERGDLHAVHRHLDRVVRALPPFTDEPERPDAAAPADQSVAACPPVIRARTAPPIPASSDPKIAPAATPVVTPRRSRRTAQQHVDSAPLMLDQNPNRQSESSHPVRHACITPNPIDGGQTFRSDSVQSNEQLGETLPLLVDEGIYPTNVSRFAALPPHVIHAAIVAANVPRGHPHRPGRIVERLESYARGLWRPPVPALSGCIATSPAPSVVRAETVLTHYGSSVVHDGRQEDGPRIDGADSSPAALWSALLADLRSEIAQEEFDIWLSDTRLVDILNNTAVIAVANVFAREQISASYQGAIERLLQQHVGRRIAVSLVIG